MSKHLQAALWTAAICAYVALAALACLGRPLGEFDESLPLVQARLMRQGLTPYTDFFSHYPPLSIYLHAGMFALLGETALAQHALHFLFWLPVLALFWRWASRLLGGNGLALPATLLFAAGCFPILMTTSWIGFSLALMALFVYGAAGDQQTPSTKAMALCGALAGLALVTRINFAVYTAMAVGLSLFVDLPSAARAAGWRTALRERTLRALVFGTPMAVCLAAWLLPYGRQIRVPIEQTVLFLTQMIPAHRFLDLPVHPWLLYALAAPAGWFALRILLAGKPLLQAVPPAAAGLGMALMLLWRRTDPAVYTLALALSLGLVVSLQLWLRTLRRAELAMLVFYCGLIHYALTRADEGHLWHLIPVALAFVPFLMNTELAIAAPARLRPLALAAGVALLVAWEPARPLLPEVMRGVELLKYGEPARRVADADRMDQPGSENGPWSYLYPDRDQLAAVRFLRGKTRPDEPVFSGVKNHSRLFANNVRTYWLLGRPVPTLYVNFEPGLVTERWVQEQMMADLEARHVRWAVLEGLEGGDETFRKRAYQGATLLDEYLKRTFRPVAEFGNFLILERR